MHNMTGEAIMIILQLIIMIMMMMITAITMTTIISILVSQSLAAMHNMTDT